ncbi:hypothetical protein BJV78DRAFT_198931 [Lactifluus subvellereus]|nr:hypothetical protein BJV78DRAFT_198931 [Lactifluus subvellereus]
MDDGTIADVESSSVEGTLTDVVVRVLISEGWNRQTELVKSAFESLGNGEDQPATDTFNRAAVQDAGGTMAAFEVQTLSVDDNGDLRIHSCWFSVASQGTTSRDIFSLNTTSEHFSLQYHSLVGISSGILEREFADRTTRVIVEKAAPFYARNVRKVNQ